MPSSALFVRLVRPCDGALAPKPACRRSWAHPWRRVPWQEMHSDSTTSLPVRSLPCAPLASGGDQRDERNGGDERQRAFAALVLDDKCSIVRDFGAHELFSLAQRDQWDAFSLPAVLTCVKLTHAPCTTCCVMRSVGMRIFEVRIKCILVRTQASAFATSSSCDVIDAGQQSSQEEIAFSIESMMYFYNSDSERTHLLLTRMFVPRSKYRNAARAFSAGARNAMNLCVRPRAGEQQGLTRGR